MALRGVHGPWDLKWLEASIRALSTLLILVSLDLDLASTLSYLMGSHRSRGRQGYRVKITNWKGDIDGCEESAWDCSWL